MTAPPAHTPGPAVAAPPVDARLPRGFAVAWDRDTRTVGPGVLLGGAPLRLLRLSAVARARLRSLTGPAADPSAVAPPTEPGAVQRAEVDGDSGLPGSLVVTDRTSANLARQLLDAGVAHPRPRPALGPSPAEVTVVIPVKDRPAGLDRLLAGIRATAGSIAVLVVDDGSAGAAEVRRIADRYAADLLRHPVARGPAAARNHGLARAATPYVALLDSDCVPRPGWLTPLLAHFADPLVAAAAPRIVAMERSGGLAARYEAVASALDLGPREAAVTPHGRVPYVPSAALLVRRDAVGEGYDEAMHVAEDVDLVWRLVAAGWRIRYEPTAEVAHDHRTRLISWFTRRAFYGTGAAPLSARHGPAVAPMVISPWSLGPWAAVLLLGPRRGGPVAAAVLALAARRLAPALSGVERPQVLAARLVGLGAVAAGRQLVSGLVRHYWPVSLAAAVVGRRARRVLVAAAVADGLAAWWPHRRRIDPATYLLVRRLDDIAYGTGLWLGALRARRTDALRPVLRATTAAARPLR